MITKSKLVLSVIFIDGEDRGCPSSGRLYQYFVPPFIEHDFKPGDLAIVKGSSEKMCLVRVEEVIDAAKPHKATKAIIGTADISHYQRETDRRARRAELIHELEKLEARRTERARFAELAKGDAEAATLVAELTQLDAAA